MAKSQFILSTFADVGVTNPQNKNPREQVQVSARLGLGYYAVRTVNFTGNKQDNKNIIYFTRDELASLRDLNKVYCMQVSSIGSPIGKSGLLHGATAKAEHKRLTEVIRQLYSAFIAGNILGTKLIRGFSFYPPLNSDPNQYYQNALDKLGYIEKYCRREGFLYGIEVEANLIGRNAEIVTRFVRDLNSKNVVAIYDGANLHVQGLNAVEEYQKMRDVIGWAHINDCSISYPRVEGDLDEKALKDFCPADVGLVGHREILSDLESRAEEVYKRLAPFGISGIPLELEPHLSQGGQYGGSTGPRGMGVALRGLIKVLDEAGIDYLLRNYDSINAQKQG